jgi:glycerophosphoryl diester phosphodiesterase
VLSIEKANEARVDEVEIDLRVTRDQQVILAHDQFIIDKKGAQYVVANHTYKELLKIKPDLTRFSEAVKAVNHRVPILIEVKPKVNTIPIIAELQQLFASGHKPKDFLLGSFSQHTLRALHEAFPKVESVVIEHFSGIHATWRAKRIGAKRINMGKYALWAPFIKGMALRGYKLYVYTLNDPKQAKKWAKYGMAGVITDRPDLFR